MSTVSSWCQAILCRTLECLTSGIIVVLNTTWLMSKWKVVACCYYPGTKLRSSNMVFSMATWISRLSLVKHDCDRLGGPLWHYIIFRPGRTASSPHKKGPRNFGIAVAKLGSFSFSEKTETPLESKSPLGPNPQLSRLALCRLGMLHVAMRSWYHWYGHNDGDKGTSPLEKKKVNASKPPSPDSCYVDWAKYWSRLGKNSISCVVRRCRSCNSMAFWVALLVSRYLSNTASFVFYGIACLIQLIVVAALLTTFEEHMRQASSVRQVAPLIILWLWQKHPDASWDHTNPSHPHHPLFNKFKSGFTKCKHLLNTHTQLSLFTAINIY